MNDDYTGIIVGVIVFGLLIFIIIMGIRFFIRHLTRPVSKKEALQSYINAKASEQPVGPGEGLKRMGGFAKLFWFIISLGLAYLLISGGIIEKFNLP